MYDFHNLRVYKKAILLNNEILKFLMKNRKIDLFLDNQLKRASISLVINIAEGSGKFSKADRKNFYTIARASTYECVSLLEILKSLQLITDKKYLIFYRHFEVISKMLLGLIKSNR